MKTIVVTRLAIDPLSDLNQSLRRFDSEDLANRWKATEWLGERLEFFSRSAVHSMRSQIEEPDRWVILIDELHEKSTEKVAEGLPAFSDILILRSGDSVEGSLRAYLATFGPDLLTIRLDSDDLVAPNFIQVARAIARPNRGINFPHGVQYFSSSGDLVHRWINSNPTVGFRAVGCRIHIHDFGQHRNVGKVVRVVSRPSAMPMYMKISHSLNHVPFQPNGLPVVQRSKVYEHFGLSERDFPMAVESRLWTFLSHVGYRLNRLFPGLAVRVERFRRAFTETGFNPLGKK